jgi:hypothetical protein
MYAIWSCLCILRSASYILYSTRWQQITRQNLKQSVPRYSMNLRRIIWVGSPENRRWKNIWLLRIRREFDVDPWPGGGGAEFTLTAASHGRKIWKLAQAFKYIQMYTQMVYLIVLVLYWNKHNRATFFGKYKILWGVPLPPRGYPLKVLWPGSATKMLFLQIYQKYFIIGQTYNKNKLF